MTAAFSGRESAAMSNTIMVLRPVRSAILVFIGVGAFRSALFPADFDGIF